MLNTQNQLPDYPLFCEQITALALPLSGSKLHGIMCGYICAGALHDGEAYLRALTINQRGESARVAAQALFGLYAISQQQIDEDNFSFQLLLPDDEQLLEARAQAFGEWCDGFTKAMDNAGISAEQLEEESQEALMHLVEFSELDYGGLTVNEDDEKALMEVSEYTRMAVLRLYWDIKTNQQDGRTTDRVTH